MFAPEAPYNSVSEGRFYQKGLYLDKQYGVIHNRKDIIANCPRLEGPNIRILELHLDHWLIEQKSGFSEVAIKPSESREDENQTCNTNKLAKTLK